MEIGEKQTIGCVLMASGASRRFSAAMAAEGSSAGETAFAGGIGSAGETAFAGEPGFAGETAAHGKTTGKSTNKLLAELDGLPLFLWSARALRDAGLVPLVVTRSREIAELAENAGYSVFLHDDPAKSATIRTGLSCLMNDPVFAGMSGCLFAQADQPLVRPESIRAMLAAFMNEDSGAAVRLSWRGQAGSPVLFPASAFPALLELKGEEGGNVLLQQSASSVQRNECSMVQTREDGMVQTREDSMVQMREDSSGALCRNFLPVRLVEAAALWELWDADTPEMLERIRTECRSSFQSDR